jgi:hypothetical protein
MNEPTLTLNKTELYALAAVIRHMIYDEEEHHSEMVANNEHPSSHIVLYLRRMPRDALRQAFARVETARWRSANAAAAADPLADRT